MPPADLPLWCPRGACPPCRLLPPAFSFFFAPIPPAPFPSGEGGDFRLFYARGFAPGTPAFNRLRHLQSLPSKYPAGVCLLSHLPTLPLVYFLAPIPPTRARRALFPAGRGRFLVYFAGGFAPGTPALDRLRHLQSLPSKYPAAEIRGSPQNRQEAVPYEQCRQPRRGGTGGEELRRLRWSSPPGQGEPVPQGESPPANTTAAGIASAAGAHTPAIPYITACFFQPADV